jgi:hypothetical protein
MKTKIGTLSSESLLAALILVTAAGCTHYWERPGGSIADFERDSAACIEDVRHSPISSGGRKTPKNFANPPPALAGRRYQKR